MKIDIRARLSGERDVFEAGIDVPELFYRQFEPLKTTDNAIVAKATGDMLASGQDAQVVVKAREDAAEIIAEELTKMIIAAMSQHDTHNGYM